MRTIAFRRDYSHSISEAAARIIKEYLVRSFFGRDITLDWCFSTEARSCYSRLLPFFLFFFLWEGHISDSRCHGIINHHVIRKPYIPDLEQYNTAIKLLGVPQRECKLKALGRQKPPLINTRRARQRIQGFVSGMDALQLMTGS
jgi:hypothetical protein